jgi:hypothetical protein
VYDANEDALSRAAERIKTLFESSRSRKPSAPVPWDRVTFLKSLEELPKEKVDLGARCG